MAKIIITLQDTENGHVNIESTPHMKKLAEIARGGDLTPAEGYALAALAKIIKDSQENKRKDIEDQVSRGLIAPIPRFH